MGIDERLGDQSSVSRYDFRRLQGVRVTDCREPLGRDPQIDDPPIA
jgi:hypothetical protein